MGRPLTRVPLKRSLHPPRNEAMPRKRIRAIGEIFHVRLPSATDRVPSKRTRLVDERVFSGSLLEFENAHDSEQKYRMRPHVRSETWNRVPIWIRRDLCGIRQRRGDPILRFSYKYRRKGSNVIDLLVAYNERPRVRAACRRVLTVKCVRTDVLYSRKDRRPDFFYFDTMCRRGDK